MLILLLWILLLAIMLRYHLFRYMFVLTLIIIALFGQLVFVVGNNMNPNINVGDVVLCIKPYYYIGNYKAIDLARIPLVKNLFQYNRGDVIIIQTKSEKDDNIIMQPKMIRVIGLPGDKVSLRKNGMSVNSMKITYKSYGPYYHEKIGNKSYLILPSIRDTFSTIEVPNEKLLCMYDNRLNPEQNKTEFLIDKSNVLCVPILNLSNLRYYYEFLVR